LNGRGLRGTAARIAAAAAVAEDGHVLRLKAPLENRPRCKRSRINNF